MIDKKAFVFDTNFIIQNQKLDEVIANLKDQYTVYVAQISIDERIAQQCRDLKSRYEEIEKCKDKCSHFAIIEILTTYDEECKIYQNAIQKKYEECFGNCIIPFEKSNSVFEIILDRANKKLPPFSDVKGASDKGFKDCLLWLSIISYFKSAGENEVVFVTDDKSAFKDKKEFLINEFENETAKKIVFKQNSFYRDILLSQEPIENGLDTSLSSDNLTLLRNEINEAVNGLLGVECEDYFGNPYWTRTFTTSILFDKDYTKAVFEELDLNFNKHILEKSVPANKILDLDGRIENSDMEIPIDNLETVLKIYQKIIKKYPNYSEQFFEASTNLLNHNYVSSKTNEDDDDLPF